MSPFRPWRIVHVHMDRPLPALEAAQAIEGVYAVFWWRDIPLGLERMPAVDLPLSPRGLGERGLKAMAPAVAHALGMTGPDRPLSTLHEHVEACDARARPLAASVIICTRDRPDSLERCLRSLSSTLGPRDDIVVVDNGPSSSRVRGLAHRQARVRYVHEPRAGLDIARNTGIRQSGGGIVVFCDDDVTVERSWLTRLKAAFLDPAVTAATGLVLPARLETEAEYVFDTYWGFNRGFKARLFDRGYFARNVRRGVPAWEIGAGASMAFRKDVLRQVGGFDERLDVGAAGCSGDSEMWYRLLAAGHACRYEPTAVSYHEHRREMHDLERQVFGYMRGHSAELLVQFERHRHWGNLRRAFVRMPLYYARALLQHALGSDRRRTQTLSYEIAGWLSGIRFYLGRPRHAPPPVVDHVADVQCTSPT